MTTLPKLGIFGDSFAAPNLTNARPSWCDVLREHYDIEIWAVNGSSILYSYTRFKEHYQKYDKIIFVVTCSIRIWLKNMFQPDHPHWTYTHINSPDSAKKFLAHFEKHFPENLLAVNTLKAAVYYYDYLQEHEVDFLLARSMLHEIKSLKPDTLLVSALYSDPLIAELVGHENYLNDIFTLENNSVGITFEYLQTIYDYRQCHLSDENNLILGQKMLEWLDNNKVNLNIEDFYIPQNKEEFISKYFKLSNKI